MLGFELFVFILRIMAITLKNGRLKMRILIQSEKNFLILRLWDFATGNVFCTFGWGGGGGGGLHKNVSQILAIIDFFKQKNYPKNRVRKEEYYRQHNFKPNKSFKLGQIWRRQLHS